MAALSALQSEKILKKAADWLEPRPEIRLALVYGSFARGQATEQSDLDLAVAADRPLDPDRKIEWAQYLGKLTRREVDLIDLRVATGTILSEALTQGRIVKKDDPALLARILKRMWIDREDFEKNRDEMLSARRKKAFGG